MFLKKYFVWNIMTGGYRLVEKYENAYHFIVAGRPAMGNTLQSKSPTFSTMIWTKTTITMENNYPSIDDPQWVTYI